MFFMIMKVFLRGICSRGAAGHVAVSPGGPHMTTRVLPSASIERDQRSSVKAKNAGGRSQ